MPRPRNHWGWGHADEQPTAEERRAAAAGLAEHLGFGSPEPRTPVALETLADRLAPSRLEPPRALGDLCSTDPADRVRHATGRAFRDLVRVAGGAAFDAPDVVARPRDADDVAALLAWCADAGAAAIPFGGGTSVVAGVEPRLGNGYAGAVTIHLGALDRVLEVDPVSLAARIQAGATGPGLERQLGEHGLTLRFYPQSFEFATFGGWVATRAGGHFATRLTHIDDLVESVRAITPGGEWASRRLPGSGAGPSPDRLLLGSEGTLGVIVDGWARVRPRPEHRAGASVRFPTFAAGAEAVRAIVQADLGPANCRLIDAEEARLTLAGDGSAALLVLGFESPDAPVDAALARALELSRAHGGDAGTPRTSSGDGGSGGGAGAWREAFLRAPYLRDTLVLMDVISDTFETAITWDRFERFHAAVSAAATAAVEELCGAGTVTCRLTHVYPDGPAPYFTILAPANGRDQVEVWDAIKTAASDAVIAAGGTITHHHAVGRDHRPWYDRQRPDPFAAALRGAKAAVDPAGVLNPGVLIDPEPAG